MADQEDSAHDSDLGSVRQAMALEYKSEQELPTVSATGVGEIARQIVSLAEQAGVPITKDPKLARLLGRNSQGSEICSESFVLVAEIIAFLYETDLEWREQHGFLDKLLNTEVLEHELTSSDDNQ